MSPSQIYESIHNAFKHLKLLSCWEYLEAVGGQLIVSAIQNPAGGEIVDRRGALYIREKSIVVRFKTIVNSLF